MDQERTAPDVSPSTLDTDTCPLHPRYHAHIYALRQVNEALRKQITSLNIKIDLLTWLLERRVKP